MLLCPEGSPRGGGETKRQKTHYDQRLERDSESGRTSSTVEGNATEPDAVAFLNHFSSSSLSNVSDGALSSPVTIEAPGFNDLIDFEEDDASRRPSADISDTVTEQETGAEGGMEFIRSLTDSRTFMELAHTSRRTDSGSEGTGVNACDGEERLSNCDLPPNSQIEEVNNQRFEGVFKSLMTLLNEYKDKNSGIPADDHRVTFGRDRDLMKPVCEIRPFVDLGRCDEPASRSRGGTRRRGRGSQARRNGRVSARDTRGATGSGTSTPVRESTRGRGRRGRRGPILMEDGLEIIEPPVQEPSVEDETAMATAMLQDLVEEVDLDMF